MDCLSPGPAAGGSVPPLSASQLVSLPLVFGLLLSFPCSSLLLAGDSLGLGKEFHSAARACCKWIHCKATKRRKKKKKEGQHCLIC